MWLMQSRPQFTQIDSVDAFVSRPLFTPAQGRAHLLKLVNGYFAQVVPFVREPPKQPEHVRTERAHEVAVGLCPKLAIAQTDAIGCTSLTRIREQFPNRLSRFM